MRATIPSKIGMAPPHPGAFIRDEILDELGLSVSAAAKALGVRRATLSDLLNGNAALSAEMALRVEKAFGVDMETLLRMQAWHDAVAMRRRQIGVKRYRVAVLKLAGSPKVTRGRLLRPPPKVRGPQVSGGGRPREAGRAVGSDACPGLAGARGSRQGKEPWATASTQEIARDAKDMRSD